MYKLFSIINKNTHQEVCSQYLHKPINLKKSTLTKDKPLKIIYEDDSFFTHEMVLNVSLVSLNIIKIETTNKIWTIIYQ